MLEEILIVGSYTIVLNNWLIGRSISALWSISNEGRKESYKIQTALLGGLESIGYLILFTQFFLYKRDFLFAIVAYLTIKTLPSVWKVKEGQDGQTKDKQGFDAGERFSIFLIGSLTNLYSAFSGAYVLNLLLNNDLKLAFFVGFSTSLTLFITQKVLNKMDK